MTRRAIAVTAIGESLVDIVVPAHGGVRVEHPGGSPMNVALGLARLNRTVSLVTHVGSDARGSAIIRHLEKAGVTLAAGSIRDEPSSTATAHVKADGSADYVFDLRWSLPTGLASSDRSLAGSDIVHVGSIGAFLEPGGSTVVSLLEQLVASDDPPLISFDPNVRPSIVPDHGAALRRFERIAAVATAVKLSDEDAEWLYPGRDLESVADHILQLGAGLVATTLGGDGALMSTRTIRLAVPGFPVDVADTIGAGDSFMSALIDCIARSLEEGASAESLRDGHAFDQDLLASTGEFAALCAAVTVSRPGADPPRRSELDDARRTLVPRGTDVT